MKANLSKSPDCSCYFHLSLSFTVIRLLTSEVFFLYKEEGGKKEKESDFEEYEFEGPAGQMCTKSHWVEWEINYSTDGLHICHSPKEFQMTQIHEYKQLYGKA